MQLVVDPNSLLQASDGDNSGHQLIHMIAFTPIFVHYTPTKKSQAVPLRALSAFT